MKEKKEWEKYSMCCVLFRANDASLKPKSRMISFYALHEECTIKRATEVFVRKHGADKVALYSPAGIGTHPCTGK